LRERPASEGASPTILIIKPEGNIIGIDRQDGSKGTLPATRAQTARLIGSLCSDDSCNEAHIGRFSARARDSEETVSINGRASVITTRGAGKE
jgi:hypothetical protein